MTKPDSWSECVHIQNHEGSYQEKTNIILFPSISMYILLGIHF